VAVHEVVAKLRQLRRGNLDPATRLWPAENYHKQFKEVLRELGTEKDQRQ
jgi:hypothetical protein